MIDPEPLEKSRLRLVALTVATAMFLHNLDSTLIVTSLPQIASGFGMKAVDLSAAISAYVLASAALLPLSGWLADRHGARQVFVTAMVLFTTASVGCAVAPSFPLFIAGRIGQGFAGAMMVPVGRAVVLRQSEGSALLNAVALITWPALLAPVVAPVLGGFITTYFNWRWNFLLNVPLGLVGIVAAQKLMPADLHGQRRPLDLVGLVLLTAGLAGMLYALEDFAGDVGRRSAPLLLAAAGAACLLGGLRHLRRHPHPLLDLSAYSVPTFYATNGGAGLIFRATVAATPFLLPLLLQLAFGLTALQAGTFIMVYFVGNLVMKPATTPLLKRFGFRRVLIWNGALSGVCIAACGWTDPLHWPVLSSAVFLFTGLTRSMQFTCMNTLGFADLTRAQRGPGSTLHSMLLQVSTALGVATAAIILQKSTQYHGGTQPVLGDFRLAFALVGAAGFLAGLGYRRLSPDAGAAVTGHAASG